MAASDVPAIVKHTVVAIHGKLKGQSPKDRAISAWNIARARLEEYGFLSKGSQNAKSTGIKLTSKGVLQNREHRLEAKHPIVEREFADIFAFIEPAEVNPSQPSKQITTDTSDKRENAEEQKKADATEQVIDLLKRAKKQTDPSKSKRKDKL